MAAVKFLVTTVMLGARQVPVMLRSFLRQGNQAFWNYGFFLTVQILACSALLGEAKELRPLVGSAVMLLTVIAGGLYGVSNGLWGFFGGCVVERYRRARYGASAVLGFLFTRFVIIYSAVLIQFASLYFLYHVRLLRSVPAFLVALALVVMCFVVLGFCIVTLSRSHYRTYLVGNILFVPMVIFCGAVMPVRMLPQWARAVSKVLPSTYAMEALQGGLGGYWGWAEIAVPLALLAGWTVILAAVALFSFDWGVLERGVGGGTE